MLTSPRGAVRAPSSSPPIWLRPAGVLALGVALGVAIGGGVVAAGNPLYVAGGLVGLAVGIAMLASVQVGVLAFLGVATLLPFAVVPVPLGTFKLTFLDVTVTLLLLVWLTRLLFVRVERLQLSGLEPFVLAYVGFAVFSFIIGTGTTSEIMRLFLKMINSIILFFTTVNCIRTRAQLERALAAFVIGASISSAIGIVLYFLPAATSARLLTSLGGLGYPTGGDVLRYLPSTQVLRAISTSIDPNIFGAMVMLASVIAVSLLLSGRPVLDRRLMIGLVAVMGGALLLSYSRGSLGGFIAASLFVVWFRYRRIWPFFAVAALLLVLAVAPPTATFFGHIVSGLTAQDQAAAMRLGEYKDAFRLIQEYPWFGVGFGVAPDVDLYIGVSSIYLLVAEQMGLIGLASYLLAVGLLIWRGLGPLLLDRSGGYDPALLATTAALFSALIAGGFDHHFVNLRFPHVVALFWFVGGLLVVAAKLRAEGGASAAEAGGEISSGDQDAGSPGHA